MQEILLVIFGFTHLQLQVSNSLSKLARNSKNVAKVLIFRLQCSSLLALSTSKRELSIAVGILAPFQTCIKSFTTVLQTSVSLLKN